MAARKGAKKLCLIAFERPLLAPLTAISTSRLPHREQTSRARHSSTVVSGPYQRAWSAGSGSLR